MAISGYISLVYDFEKRQIHNINTTNKEFGNTTVSNN